MKFAGAYFTFTGEVVDRQVGDKGSRGDGRVQLHPHAGGRHACIELGMPLEHTGVHKGLHSTVNDRDPPTLSVCPLSCTCRVGGGMPGDLACLEDDRGMAAVGHGILPLQGRPLLIVLLHSAEHRVSNHLREVRHGRLLGRE